MESWLSPMLAEASDVVPEGDDWIIEGKFDGWRGLIHVQADGTVKLYGGRNCADYSGQLPYIEEAIAKWLPPDTAIDGEILGGEWGDVQGIMTSSNPHVPSAREPALQFVAWDVLRHAGADLRSSAWFDRRTLLDALWLEPNAPRYQYRPSPVRVSPYGPATAEMHEQFLAIGLEGSVCKRRDSTYLGRRSPAWVKIKPRQTADAKVVGFKPGKKGGQWDGKVGAFVVELLDSGVRTTIKCGTNERHDEAHEHPERWLNVIIEIEHRGINKSGVPKNPQFGRRRDDRTPPKAPVQPPKQPTGKPRASKRNYGAMKDAKLLRTIRELRAQEGEAMRKTDTPEADLAIACGIAADRGLDLEVTV